MSTGGPKQWESIDVCTLEADLAFFEARLSLAGGDADTAYRRAQVKTFQTLGRLIGDSLNRLRDPTRPASAA